MIFHTSAVRYLALRNLIDTFTIRCIYVKDVALCAYIDQISSLIEEREWYLLKSCIFSALLNFFPLEGLFLTELQRGINVILETRPIWQRFFVLPRISKHAFTYGYYSALVSVLSLRLQRLWLVIFVVRTLLCKMVVYACRMPARGVKW